MEELSPTRRKLLVFWYQYYAKEFLWPNMEEACDELNLSKTAVHYQVSILVKTEWMKKKGRRIGLTRYAYNRLQEAELRAKGAIETEDPTKKLQYQVDKIKFLRPTDERDSKSS